MRGEDKEDRGANAFGSACIQEVRPCVATQEAPADGMAQRRSVAHRSSVAPELGAQDLLLR
jgi:hypothetical protein